MKIDSNMIRIVKIFRLIPFFKFDSYIPVSQYVHFGRGFWDKLFFKCDLYYKNNDVKEPKYYYHWC